MESPSPGQDCLEDSDEEEVQKQGPVAGQNKRKGVSLAQVQKTNLQKKKASEAQGEITAQNEQAYAPKPLEESKAASVIDTKQPGEEDPEVN